MILLFDIDSLLYSACFNVDSPEEAMFKFDESYQKVINDLGEFYEVEEVIPFGLSKNNFRKFITKTYKANRSKEKPQYFSILCQYVAKYYDPIQANGMETDDLVAIYREKIGAENCIIISIDKDYNQFPFTKIYNYYKKNFQTFSKEDALYNFYEQMIVGDTADNINFCKGYGKAYAKKLFKGVSTDFGYKKKVLGLFKEIYRSKGRERFIQCYHLLKLGYR
jgi:5'-3' exonuclease